MSATARHVGVAAIVAALGWILVQVGWFLWGPTSGGTALHAALAWGTPAVLFAACVLQRHPNHR